MSCQIPLTIPTFLQPLIEAWAVWLVTTFFSIPLSFFYAFWDFPITFYNFLFLTKPAVVLITGSNSGIGAELAHQYATPNVTLGLLARDEAERLNVVAEICKRKGANVLVLPCDISNVERLVEILEEFDNRHPIELLVANAGQAGVTVDGESKTWEDSWQRIIDVNLVGTVATVMTVFKRMKSRGHGQIAITSSIAGIYSPPQMCYYNAIKAALISFGRDLRYLGRNDNVKVSVIVPGYIGAHMTLDPRQPLPLPTWAAASPAKLSKIIQWQLYENNPMIAWPFWEFIFPYAAKSLPYRVLDTVHFIVGRGWGYVSTAGDRGFT
ncbi:hypothetical protein G9A89_003109 [Geosiphon pyriformis]|nr:hypothetical protein G9A89_003109 [Geosiphon pyriformis]